MKDDNRTEVASWVRCFLLAFWAWGGSLAFAPLGLPALKLQLVHSKIWLSLLVFFTVTYATFILGEPALGVLFVFSVASLVLSFVFLEARFSIEVGWLLSASMSAVLVTGIAFLIELILPEKINQEIILPLQEALGSMKIEGGIYTLLTGRELTPALIFYQTPGFLAIYWLLSLFLVSQWERGMAQLFKLKHSIPVKRLRFERLRWPDWVLWIFILSLGLSYLRIDILSGGYFWLHLVGLNLFNLLAFVYCLQGLAVMESIMAFFKVPPVLKLWVYLGMVLLLPFFFLLSSLGVVDYWIDFRQKVKRIKLEKT